MEYTARWRKVNVVEPHKVVLFSTGCMTCKVRRRVKVDDDDHFHQKECQNINYTTVRLWGCVCHPDSSFFLDLLCEFLKVPNAVLNNLICQSCQSMKNYNYSAFMQKKISTLRRRCYPLIYPLCIICVYWYNRINPGITKKNVKEDQPEEFAYLSKLVQLKTLKRLWISLYQFNNPRLLGGG